MTGDEKRSAAEAIFFFFFFFLIFFVKDCNCSFPALYCVYCLRQQTAIYIYHEHTPMTRMKSQISLVLNKVKEWDNRGLSEGQGEGQRGGGVRIIDMQASVFNVLRRWS